MKTANFCLGLTFVLLILSTAAPVLAQGGRSRELALANGWRFDYRQARRTAARDNKPLMVVFRCVP